MQVFSKFIEDLAIVTSKLGNLAVTTGKVAGNAITGAKILLANAEWLRGRNAANSADVNIIRVNATDELEIEEKLLFTAILPESALAPTTDDQLANKAYVDAAAGGGQGGYETITLSGTDITNQYVDLAEEVTANTLQVEVGGVVQRQGVDYTLSVVATKTRITFAGDLATGGAAELVAGDVLYNQYLF